jgi:hypothetical protein
MMIFLPIVYFGSELLNPRTALGFHFQYPRFGGLVCFGHFVFKSVFNILPNLFYPKNKCDVRILGENRCPPYQCRCGCGQMPRLHGRPSGEDVAVGCVAFALLALSNGNVQEETVIPTQQSTTPKTQLATTK